MKIFLLLAGLLVSPLFADPVKVESFTVNKFQYVNPTVEKISESEARVIHSSGTSRIPMEYLPVEIQQKVGYDAAKAKELAETQRAALEVEIAAMAKLNEIAARTKRFHGEIIGTDHPSCVLAEGRGSYESTVPYKVYSNGTASSSTGLGGVSGGGSELVQPKPELVGRPEKGVSGTVIIVGHPKGKNLAMEEWVDVDVIEEGTETYMEERYRKFRVLKVYPVK